jgi:pimeloyl-ACP methyl ester carboxylesterase
MEGFVPLFANHGYRVLLPDDRAHGNSGGSIITYGLREKYDAIDWAHWLQAQGCQTIYGFGQSLGASILIQAAAVEPVFKTVVAECPYSDLRSIGEYRVRRMASGLPNWVSMALSKVMIKSSFLYARVRFGVDLSRVSPLEDIAHTETPILLIHGLDDNQTPPENSERLAKANPHTELWLVPATRHVAASRTHPEEFNARVLSWFTR